MIDKLFDFTETFFEMLQFLVILTVSVSFVVLAYNVGQSSGYNEGYKQGYLDHKNGVPLEIKYDTIINPKP